MSIEATENSVSNKCSFACECCAYTCCSNQRLKQHFNTKKHITLFSNINGNVSNDSIQCDICNKSYKDRSGLWRHRKKCTVKTDDAENQSLIRILISDNKELRNLLMEQAKEHMTFITQQYNEHRKETSEIMNKVIDNVKPVTITNSNNKAFNINLFLNETCKDAINFSDFVKGIAVSREELENTGNVGFVDGVSKILLDTLKQLSITERPIHCTDVKRETMYIKEDNKWNKEEDDTKLRDAISMVTRQSMKTLCDWKETNPDYKDSHSDFSNQCINMQMYSVAGTNREVYYPKVIATLAKEVMVDKSIVIK